MSITTKTVDLCLQNLNIECSQWRKRKISWFWAFLCHF